MRGRTRGNKRAANSQRDTASVTVNIQKTFQIPIASGATSNAIAINIWSILQQAQMFTSYRGMYDQVKLMGVTARIRGLNGSSALTLSNTPTICTAWDRNGFDNTEDENSGVNSVPHLSYSTLTSYSSSIISNWSPGNAFKITRHIYPSTISEKSYYVSCGALTASTPLRNPAVSFLTQNGVNFKPLLLIGAYCGFAGTTQQSIGFMIEFDITCAFRGLRKWSITADPNADQILIMAGEYLNGQSGNIVEPIQNGNWVRTNNDGVIQDPGEVPTAPPIKAE